MKSKKYYGDEEKKHRTSKDVLGLSGWDIFKGTAGLVACGCASTTVHRYLLSVMPKGATLPERVVIAVGTYLVTGLVGSRVEQYVISELDSMRNAINNANKTGDADVDNG